VQATAQALALELAQVPAQERVPGLGQVLVQRLRVNLGPHRCRHRRRLPAGKEMQGPNREPIDRCAFEDSKPSL
jgi:hypothetical protein